MQGHKDNLTWTTLWGQLKYTGKQNTDVDWIAREQTKLANCIWIEILFCLCNSYFDTPTMAEGGEEIDLGGSFTVKAIFKIDFSRKAGYC